MKRTGRSNNSQNPPFDSRDFSLLRRQTRREESTERTAAAGTLEPCCNSVSGLLIAVPIIPCETPCLKCVWGVNLRDHRSFSWTGSRSFVIRNSHGVNASSASYLSNTANILYVSESNFLPSMLVVQISLASFPLNSAWTSSTSGIRQLRRLT